jgi:hypothetical protein
MRLKRPLYALFLCLFFHTAHAQLISAPEPQPAVISGTVTDTDGGIIPGAAVSLDGGSPIDHVDAVTNDSASFLLKALHPGISYRLTISATGFAVWTSPSIVLTPGQELEVENIQLRVGGVETSVNAVFSEQVALEQVKVAEKQRVFGIIPNFYVVYDHQFVPLTTGLKFRLALRASTDVVSIGAAAFLAGINQAADTPNYVQGARGYGQRFGAAYANGASNIMIGGAILPSLLHQDPRYFYQGTGTKKSRALHALSAPFIAKGDNGKWQPNYSSIGGDLASGGLSNLYYPQSNRGTGLVFGNALITTGGRMLNALAQEFVLRKLTTKAKPVN